MFEVASWDCLASKARLLHKCGLESRNRCIDLGTLGGSFSYIADLNDSGQSVGISSLAGDAMDHATLWQSITPA